MSKTQKAEAAKDNLPVAVAQADGDLPADAGSLEEFNILRELLFKKEQQQLQELQDKLLSLKEQIENLPPVQKEEVSNVLPDAVIHRSQIDNQLSDATLPIVEKNIRDSVKQNPQNLAEALFPVIGPAIRRAIAEALSSMVQSMNQTLEYSLSPQGLKWRMEALQAGKPFAEIVMLKTLLYRVEQVFLIHQETGLMLQHATLNKAQANEDADMVSAMLTAIQDFVKDSFKTDANATLDTLQVGELAVWLERSPDLILAAVIRGNAPLGLRDIFKQALEEIESAQRKEIDDFSGDPAEFEKSRHSLEGCLQFQAGHRAEKKKKLLTPVNIGAAFLGIALLLFGFFYIRDQWRWSGYVSKLEGEPGIVVAEYRRGWRQHYVRGLRDGLAADPEKLLADFGYQQGDIAGNWESYQSSRPEIAQKRAESLLKPPPGISLALEDGVLVASGKVSPEWYLESEKLIPALAGINGFRLSPQALNYMAQGIESSEIRFRCKTTEIEDRAILAQVAKELEVFIGLAKPSAIEVRGYADGSGPASSNASISQARAEKAASELLAASEKLRGIKVEKIGSGDGGQSGCMAKVKVKREE